MTWTWLRCRLCRREVRAHDLQWCSILKSEACDACRERAAPPPKPTTWTCACGRSYPDDQCDCYCQDLVEGPR